MATKSAAAIRLHRDGRSNAEIAQELRITKGYAAMLVRCAKHRGLPNQERISETYVPHAHDVDRAIDMLRRAGLDQPTLSKLFLWAAVYGPDS